MTSASSRSTWSQLICRPKLLLRVSRIGLTFVMLKEVTRERRPGHLFTDELHTIVGACAPRRENGTPATCSSRPAWARVRAATASAATPVTRCRKHIEKDPPRAAIRSCEVVRAPLEDTIIILPIGRTVRGAHGVQHHRTGDLCQRRP